MKFESIAIEFLTEVHSYAGQSFDNMKIFKQSPAPFGFDLFDISLCKYLSKCELSYDDFEENYECHIEDMLNILIDEKLHEC